jgi:hypothetical protein
MSEISTLEPHPAHAVLIKFISTKVQPSPLVRHCPVDVQVCIVSVKCCTYRFASIWLGMVEGHWKTTSRGILGLRGRGGRYCLTKDFIAQASKDLWAARVGLVQRLFEAYDVIIHEALVLDVEKGLRENHRAWLRASGIWTMVWVCYSCLHKGWQFLRFFVQLGNF